MNFKKVLSVAFVSALALTACNEEKKAETAQAPAAQPQQPTLPATGSEVSTPLVYVGMVGMLLGLFGMAKKKED